MLPNLKGTHVHFNLIPTIFEDPENIAEELREYRKSNVFQKKADAARFENILTPILTLSHRQKIWNQINQATPQKRIRW